jgi:HEAT repeat protein
MLRTNHQTFSYLAITVIILASILGACQAQTKTAAPAVLPVVIEGTKPTTTAGTQPKMPTATLIPNTPAPTSTATPTRAPLDLQVAGYEGTQLNSVCLEVKQAYTGMESNFKLPIEENVRHILASQGIQVLPVDGDCQATLYLNINIQPLSSYYTASGETTDPNSEGAQLCYSGVNLSGEMSLTSAQSKPVLIDLSSELEPTYGISACAETADKAPFDQILPLTIFQGLGQLWGGRFLTRAWEIENMPTHTAWKDGAIEALVRLGNDLTPVLLKEIQSDDETLRLEAARAFYHVNQDSFSLPLSKLVGLLGSPTWQARQGAVEALGWAGNQSSEALADLLAMMQDDEPAVRASTAWALAQVSSDTQTVEALRQALNDPDESVRAAAALAFGDLPASPEPLGKADLLQALQNESALVRQAAARGLYQYASDLEVMPALMVVIKDPDPRVRAAAVSTLGRTTPSNFRAIEPRVKLALADGYDEVASSAVYATGMMGMNALQLMPDIQRMMHDERVIVRSAAVWAFANIANDVSSAEALAVPEVVRMLKDPQPEVRLAACAALISLESKIAPTDKATLNALIQVLGDDQEAVRHTAAAALVLISGQPYTQDAQTWQHWLASQP